MKNENELLVPGSNKSDMDKVIEGGVALLALVVVPPVRASLALSQIARGFRDDVHRLQAEVNDRRPLGQAIKIAFGPRRKR